MARYGPVQELVHFIGSRLGQGTYRFIGIDQRCLEKRLDAAFVEGSKTSRKMAEGNDRIPANGWIRMKRETTAGIHRQGGIFGHECGGYRHKRKLRRVVSPDGSLNICSGDVVQILKTTCHNCLMIMILSANGDRQGPKVS